MPSSVSPSRKRPDVISTVVGSWPRDPELSAELEKRGSAAATPELEQLFRRYVPRAIEDQVNPAGNGLGLDEVTDGEYRRTVFFGNITGLPGFRQKALPFAFSAGDIYSSAIVEDKIEYDPSQPFAVKEVGFAREYLESRGWKKRVKVTVPGLSFLANFYPDPNSEAARASPAVRKMMESSYEKVRGVYPTLDDYIRDVQGIVANEIRAALDAGADRVQVDVPNYCFFTTVPRPEFEQVIRAQVELDNRLLSGFPYERLDAHVCDGNYWNTTINNTGHWGVNGFIPSIYELRVQRHVLELFSGSLTKYLSNLKALREHPLPRDKELGAGVISVKSRDVESVPELERRFREVTEIVGFDRTKITTGCGYGSSLESIHTREGARRKTRNGVLAARNVLREAGYDV